MIPGYANNGFLDEALEAIAGMPIKDLVSWKNRQRAIQPDE